MHATHFNQVTNHAFSKFMGTCKSWVLAILDGKLINMKSKIRSVAGQESSPATVLLLSEAF